MTAIVTLCPTDEVFKALRALVFEIFNFSYLLLQLIISI